MFVLYSQNYAARALPILFNTPKKSLLKSSYPKKYLPNFRTQKNPGIENFKPKKILRSSPSLEIPSTPPGTDTQLEASKMKGIEVCEAGDFPLGFSNNHFRKRMTAMYVNPISVAFRRKKKTFTILCAKNSTFYSYPSKDTLLSLSCQL